MLATRGQMRLNFLGERARPHYHPDRLARRRKFNANTSISVAPESHYVPFVTASFAGPMIFFSRPGDEIKIAPTAVRPNPPRLTKRVCCLPCSLRGCAWLYTGLWTCLRAQKMRIFAIFEARFGACEKKKPLQGRKRGVGYARRTAEGLGGW